MRLSDGSIFKTCANPQAHNPKTQPSKPLWERNALKRIAHVSWGPMFWPSLRSFARAPTTVRGNRCCAKRTFLQGNGLPSAVLQGNGLPSAVVTRHPLGLGKSVQSRTGLGSCKSHLQVQTPQGRPLASASGNGQAIDLCFERSPFK